MWNWAIRKIEQDAQDTISYTRQAFHNLLADHGTKISISSHTLPGMLGTAYTAWQRCDKQLAKKPRLKGQRNKLTSASAQQKTSIPFPDPFTVPDRTHLHVLGKAVGVRRMWGGS